jgi:hypothetical protein
MLSCLCNRGGNLYHIALLSSPHKVHLHPLHTDCGTDPVGLINSIIGALTGSMVSFIVPALAYNLYYMRSAEARVMAPKQPPRYARNVIFLEQ